ncbi:hypothetical protein PFISCL1PPCAC_4037, partial [Pristionchus fissidentatus]
WDFMFDPFDDANEALRKSQSHGRLQYLAVTDGTGDRCNVASTFVSKEASAEIMEITKDALDSNRDLADATLTYAPHLAADLFNISHLD